MKFGEQLRSSVISEYQWYYIDYEDLKRELKNCSPNEDDASDRHGKNKAKANDKSWTDKDEERFLMSLEKQLEKVYNKTQVKTSEIQRRIVWEQKEVDTLVNRMNERGPNEPGPGEEEFIVREEYLSDIIADVHDLAKFVQVNYTGFHKIIKKHDVCQLLHWTRSMPNR
jgi:SPX domain protein involved in polyphosphate accumulation